MRQLLLNAYPFVTYFRYTTGTFIEIKIIYDMLAHYQTFLWWYSVPLVCALVTFSYGIYTRNKLLVLFELIMSPVLSLNCYNTHFVWTQFASEIESNGALPVLSLQMGLFSLCYGLMQFLHVYYTLWYLFNYNHWKVNAHILSQT
jgi:hypothetical protein